MFNIHVVNKIKVICLWILSSRFSMILWVFFLYGRCHNLQFNIIYGIFLFFPCNVCIGCMLYYFLQIQNNVPQNACMFYIMYNGTYSKNNHVLMYLANNIINLLRISPHKRFPMSKPRSFLKCIKPYSN